MAFANFSVFAAGSLLMGVPILLHLMMKRRPRHQLFPAMRFLQLRQITNQRQMRLRHWLLLALRIVAIGILAALFSRPSVDSAGSGYWLKALLLAVLCPIALIAAAYCWVEKKGTGLLASFAILGALLLSGFAYNIFRAFTFNGAKNLGDESAPVAAAIVFDTSPRMGLRHQNLTRLDEAKEMAKNLISQLPTDSEVAIVDAAGPTVFSVDVGNAANMVESLELLGYEHSLPDLVGRAVELVSTRENKRPEVYVLSEMSEQVWQSDRFGSIRNQLEQQPQVSLFVLDVGVQTPRNVQLGEIQLNSDSLATGQPLRIATRVRGLNFEEELTVNVAIEQHDATRPVIVDDQVLLPEAVPRDRKQLKLTGSAESNVSFEVQGLPMGIHHGYVQLSSKDGLEIDDKRYFTVQVRAPLPVLIVASESAEPLYLEQAISPTELRKRGENAFDVEVIKPTDLPTKVLSDYAAIALLDPSPFEPSPFEDSNWKLLEDYVRQGGGLGLFLGRNASPKESFNKQTTSLLPGGLAFQWRPGKDAVLFVAMDNTAHPIMSYFRGRESIAAWDQSPIFKHWAFDELSPSSNVVLRFSNGKPAIVESMFGAGRILTMTTPISDRKNDPNRKPWNELPTSQNPLPFFVLMYGMFPYLASPSSQAWNHDLGEIVEIPIEQADIETTWQLFTPQLDWQNVRSDEGKLVVAATQQAGHYRLRFDQEQTTGFSTNLDPDATNIKRLEVARLDEVLGEDGYTLARGTEEINRGIGRARIGRELFPFLMLCVVGVLAMEHLISNRFYIANPVPTKS